MLKENYLTKENQIKKVCVWKKELSKYHKRWKKIDLQRTAFLIIDMQNYFLSKKWIFHKVNFKDGVTEFWIFCVIGIVGLLINELFIWYFTDQLHMYYMFSKVIATFLGFFWNFSARKFFLFR